MDPGGRDGGTEPRPGKSQVAIGLLKKNGTDLRQH